MPPLPEALAHLSTDLAEVLYVPLPFGQLVVIPPPFDVALPLLTQLLSGLALSRVPEFVYPFLKTLHRSVPLSRSSLPRLSGTPGVHFALSVLLHSWFG